MYVFLANLIVALILFFVTDLSLLLSLKFTLLNFFKFNHISAVDGLWWLSVALKVCGVLYMGLLLKFLLNNGKSVYDTWKAKRNRDKRGDELSKSSTIVDDDSNKGISMSVDSALDDDKVDSSESTGE